MHSPFPHFVSTGYDGGNMDIRKIIAVLTAGVSAALSAVSCSSDKRSEITASVPIIEEPSTEPETTTEEIIPDATYPDFPVTYPEIEKQATGSVYEAELARLSEGLVQAQDIGGFSGTGYVTGFGGNGDKSAAFDIEVPSNQHYDISFSIAASQLTQCSVTLGGEPLTSFETTADGAFTFITIYGVFLTKGASTIEIRPENGDIALDYMRLSDNTSLSELSYDAQGEPVNEDSGRAAKELLGFLSENYGKYTITGQYASGEDNSELDLIYRTTGKYPVIRFANFDVARKQYDDSFKAVDACADWYKNGGISCVSWFWSAPCEKSSIMADETDFSLKNAVTDYDIASLSEEDIRGLYGKGNISEECYSLILDIDNMAGQLTSLKNKGVPVLFRPLPEGSGNWYWWGADGAYAYKWLWDLVYKRMTGYFGLDNLIWVWNGQSESTLVDRSTFDIAAVDIYIDGQKDYGSKFYEEFAAVQQFVGSDKLIAISECGSVPDIDSSFRDNSVWSFFGIWYGKYIADENGEYSEDFTSRDTLARTYNSDGALTLDEYKEMTKEG